MVNLWEFKKKPLAPKVPRRDVWVVGGGGGVFEASRPPRNGRDCGDLYNFFADRPKIAQMDCFDPTWPQHCPDLLGQFRPAPDGASVTKIWEQLRPKLRSMWLQNGDIAGPIRNPQNACFHYIFDFSCYWWCFVCSNVPLCLPVRAVLVAKRLEYRLLLLEFSIAKS